MRDSEVAAAIVAGDPEGLAEAYDRYASPLFTYCRSLLREPADAADAVQDTFVIAASRLAGLRDQSRLRPWLYAVARNECHRRLRARAAQVATPLDAMPDVTDTSADVSGEAEREDLRMLLRSAIRGLNAGEADLVELQLRQGLDVAEIADVLGVSRNHAHALLSRARDQLEISLGALLVARSGRQDCAALDTMLQDWDGQLTVLMRKRINRHIERCPVCEERKKRELAPALLLGLAPLAALPVTAAPPGLRAHVLRLASSNSPEAVAHRASVAQRVGPFGHQGFPKPLDPPKSPWWRTRQGQVAAGVAAAAVVAAATLLAVALAGGGPGHHGVAAALGTGPAAGGSIGASSGVGPGDAGGPGGPGSPRQGAAPGASAGAPGAPTPVAGGLPSPGGGSPGGSPGATRSPSPKASTTGPAPSSPASSSSTTPPPPPPGKLSVAPTSILLSVGGSTTVSLTASGGSVKWSISESSSLIGELTASPASGTLSSGQTATVSVTAGLLTVRGQLIVDPGGITVTVVVGVNDGGLVGSTRSGPGILLVEAGRLMN
jgi:RNA polymerase sigma factor (sigma-70 family)